MKERVVRWGPAAVWAAFLFFLSSRPIPVADMPTGLDKVAHFVAYLVLGTLLARATERHHRPALLAVVIGILYAVSDEYHQSFVPGRSAEVGDVIADALGTVAGVLLYFFAWRPRASARPAAAPPESRPK